MGKFKWILDMSYYKATSWLDLWYPWTCIYLHRIRLNVKVCIQLLSYQMNILAYHQTYQYNICALQSNIDICLGSLLLKWFNLNLSKDNHMSSKSWDESTYPMMTYSNGNIFRVTGQQRGALMLSMVCAWRLNKRLCKQCWGWWFDTPSAHYDVTVINSQTSTLAQLKLWNG